MAASKAANFVVCKYFVRRNVLCVTGFKRSKSTKATKTSTIASDNAGALRATKKGASAAKAVKKFNFENLSLFGPVLKSSKGMKLDKGLRLSYLDERAPRRMRAPRLACEEPETARIVRAGQTQLEAELIDALTNVSEEEAARLAASSEDSEHKVDIRIPTKNFDLETTLNFPLFNFVRDGVPDDDKDETLCGETVTATTMSLDTAESSQQAVRYPSVTNILKNTMDEKSKLRLEKWKQRMVAEMGEEGFKNYQESILSQGKCLHTNIHDVLNGTPQEEIVVQPENEGHWRSLEFFWANISEVAHLESPVCHPHLQYRGIVDCVAVCRNELVLIDWKTSKKPKPQLSDTYDSPLQVAAYMGALNYDESYKIQVRDAMIVIAYEDGSPCQVHHLGPVVCQRHWQRWLQRLRAYWNLLQRGSPVL